MAILNNLFPKENSENLKEILDNRNRRTLYDMDDVKEVLGLTITEAIERTLCNHSLIGVRCRVAKSAKFSDSLVSNVATLLTLGFKGQSIPLQAEALTQREAEARGLDAQKTILITGREYNNYYTSYQYYDKTDKEAIIILETAPCEVPKTRPNASTTGIAVTDCVVKDGCDCFVSEFIDEKAFLRHKLLGFAKSDFEKTLREISVAQEKACIEKNDDKLNNISNAFRRMGSLSNEYLKEWEKYV